MRRGWPWPPACRLKAVAGSPACRRGLTAASRLGSIADGDRCRRACAPTGLRFRPARPRRAVADRPRVPARDARASASSPSILDFGLHADATVVFIASGAAILGLAWVVGLSTERLGSLTGPQVGGILNATFGNIAELIIAFFALQAGLIEVVKASITGSIIGNLLLVLGASVLIGGLRHGTQKFSPQIASSNAALLVLAVIGLFVPAIFAFT